MRVYLSPWGIEVASVLWTVSHWCPEGQQKLCERHHTHDLRFYPRPYDNNEKKCLNSRISTRPGVLGLQSKVLFRVKQEGHLGYRKKVPTQARQLVDMLSQRKNKNKKPKGIQLNDAEYQHPWGPRFVHWDLKNETVVFMRETALVLRSWAS